MSRNSFGPVDQPQSKRSPWSEVMVAKKFRPPAGKQRATSFLSQLQGTCNFPSAVTAVLLDSFSLAKAVLPAHSTSVWYVQEGKSPRCKIVTVESLLLGNPLGRSKPELAAYTQRRLLHCVAYNPPSNLQNGKG